MKKYFAEMVGTFILVLFGCGTAVVAGDKVGILGIAFAFGLALIGAAYGIGAITSLAPGARETCPLVAASSCASVGTCES